MPARGRNARKPAKPRETSKTTRSNTSTPEPPPKRVLLGIPPSVVGSEPVSIQTRTPTSPFTPPPQVVEEAEAPLDFVQAVVNDISHLRTSGTAIESLSDEGLADPEDQEDPEDPEDQEEDDDADAKTSNQVAVANKESAHRTMALTTVMTTVGIFLLVTYPDVQYILRDFVESYVTTRAYGTPLVTTIIFAVAFWLIMTYLGVL